MSVKRRLLLLVSMVLALGLGTWLISVSAQAAGTVGGLVMDADGPVAGATVRVRATENVTTTAADGRFLLSSLTTGEPIEVTAWSDGYYIASIHVTPTVSGITLALRPYHTVDHPDYQWISPISGTSPSACGNCHPLILPQWQNNAHGTAVFNPRFFSLYNGSNLSGTTQIGPGYQNDFPGTAGSCANCHAPGAAVDGYLSSNMNEARDRLTAGIHCDYCHKIGGGYFEPATQSVYANAPGVQSQRILRPPAGDNIFFGPFDDIKDPDTYLPLMTQSQFCAPCHQFSFWGTPIYESYQEWLSSSYATAGITCQSCHMIPNGDTHFALPEVGGLEHPPETIPSHLQLGAKDVDLLQNTVEMTLAARQISNLIEVTVTITNTGAGHHLPTDFPGRQLILSLTAVADQAGPLPQWDGPQVPDWGGAQAGLAGTAYAKLLRDVVTGEWPVVSYWKQTLIESDNRIPALSVDRTTYLFAAPTAAESVEIEAQLLFRRVFADLAAEKGWQMPDILMEEQSIALATEPFFDTYLPLVLVP